MNTPIVAFVLEATEFERGWGCRPDGFVSFKTEADADKFLAKVELEMKAASEVPYEYTTYEKVGYKEVDMAVVESLQTHGFIWTTKAPWLKPQKF